MPLVPLLKMLGVGAGASMVGEAGGRAAGETVGLPEMGSVVGEAVGGFAATPLMPDVPPSATELAQGLARRAASGFGAQAAAAPTAEQKAAMAAKSFMEQLKQSIAAQTAQEAASQNAGATGVLRLMNPNLAAERMALASRGPVRGAVPMTAEVPPQDPRLVRTPQEVATEGAASEVIRPPDPITGPGYVVPPEQPTLSGEPVPLPAQAPVLPADEAEASTFLQRIRAEILARKAAAEEVAAARPVQAASGESPTTAPVQAVETVPPPAAGPPVAASGETSPVVPVQAAAEAPTVTFDGQTYKIGEVIRSGPHTGKTVESIDDGLPTLIRTPAAQAPPAAPSPVSGTVVAPGAGGVASAEDVLPPATSATKSTSEGLPERRASTPENEFRRKLITEMSHEEARAALAKDSLTGLGSRHAWEDVQASFVEGAPPAGQNVLSMDVVGLKLANKQYGNAGGDKLLQSVGKIIGETLGQENSFHPHGDEFYSVIGDSVGDSAITALKNRVGNHVITVQTPDGQLVEVSGFGLHVGRGKTLQEADIAVNAAKDAAAKDATGRTATTLRQGPSGSAGAASEAPGAGGQDPVPGGTGAAPAAEGAGRSTGGGGGAVTPAAKVKKPAEPAPVAKVATKLDETAADDLEDSILGFEEIGMADKDYKELLPKEHQEALAKGETWRSRAERLIKDARGETVETAVPTLASAAPAAPVAGSVQVRTPAIMERAWVDKGDVPPEFVGNFKRENKGREPTKEEIAVEVPKWFAKMKLRSRTGGSPNPQVVPTAGTRSGAE